MISSCTVLRPGSNCECINPFTGRSQPHFGAKEENCLIHGFCFVECDSDCGDVSLAKGFLAKADRCVSKEPCHAVAEDSKFAVTVELAESAEQPAHQQQAVLTGTGAVVRYQGHGLGLYTYQADTGYYAQQGGDYYLVKDREGWFTFPRIAGCTSTETPFSCIAQYAASIKTKNLTGTTWSFSKDEVWTEDDSIQFLPVSSNSCLLCKKFILSSAGPAMQARPEYFGSFEREASFSAGRPVYRNKVGKFLMMKNEYTTFSVWDDAKRGVSAGRGDEGTRGLRSSSGPTCVTGAEGWQYLTVSGGWEEDTTITAQCGE